MNMRKRTTADRLREIMQSRGLKQIDILELCAPICEREGIQLKKNDISQYVSGKVAPRQDKLSVLAEALDVSEVWLLGYGADAEDMGLMPIPKTNRIPLVGTIACGAPILAEENIDVQYVYSFIGEIEATGRVAIHTDNMEKAYNVLKEKKVELSEQGDI